MKILSKKFPPQKKLLLLIVFLPLGHCLLLYSIDIIQFLLNIHQKIISVSGQTQVRPQRIITRRASQGPIFNSVKIFISIFLNNGEILMYTSQLKWLQIEEKNYF